MHGARSAWEHVRGRTCVLCLMGWLQVVGLHAVDQEHTVVAAPLQQAPQVRSGPSGRRRDA